MNAVFDEANDRDCLDLVLRVCAMYAKRDAERGWLAYDEVRKHGSRNVR